VAVIPTGCQECLLTWGSLRSLLENSKGKVLKLKKSLYGLKQSPRAWFDRLRWAMCNMGYKQCNSDHTVFYYHFGGRVTILAVYVDDMIIIGNDPLNISQLKKNLSKEFEVKDLGQLRYFLVIEIARSPKGIVLSQRKLLEYESCNQVVTITELESNSVMS
jgi:hypothetical protein